MKRFLCIYLWMIWFVCRRAKNNLFLRTRKSFTLWYIVHMYLCIELYNSSHACLFYTVVFSRWSSNTNTLVKLLLFLINAVRGNVAQDHSYIQLVESLCVPWNLNNLPPEKCLHFENTIPSLLYLVSTWLASLVVFAVGKDWSQSSMLWKAQCSAEILYSV